MKQHGMIGTIKHPFQMKFSILSVIIFLLILSSAMEIEGSRSLVDKLISSTSSISNRLKIVKAYSGPSRRGAAHAFLHINLSSPRAQVKKLTTAKAFSGPAKGGVGH
ncbi:hypothetical protein ACFX2J_016612 [Malus domestica]